jgi:hypothetical protein
VQYYAVQFGFPADLPMLAITLTAPPHCSQVFISVPKNRLSLCTQVIDWCFCARVFACLVDKTIIKTATVIKISPQNRCYKGFAKINVDFAAPKHTKKLFCPRINKMTIRATKLPEVPFSRIFVYESQGLERFG